MNKLIIFFICFIACFGISLILYPIYIHLLKSLNVNQTVSEYSLDEYKNKEKTPTMGGLIFIVVPIVILCVSIPFATILDHPKLLFIIISFIIYSLIGVVDDILIILTKKNDGISPLVKLIYEFISIIILYIIYHKYISTTIYIPYFDLEIDLKALYFIFISFVFVSEANACNFTDGMDGLCAGVSIIGLACFGVIAYFKSEYYVLLLIVCVIGSLIAYLFFNFHPARIFMGDSGSLGLGALFAGIALALDSFVPLLFIGFVFLIEMICVCIQQISCRLFKHRVFSYTPIHYAFIIKGYKETSVVFGFYVVALLSGIIGVVIGII